MASAAEGLFENAFEIDDEDDRRRMERVAHLIGATVSAVQAAQEASDELAIEPAIVGSLLAGAVPAETGSMIAIARAILDVTTWWP